MNLDFHQNIVLENKRAQLAPLQADHLPALLPIAESHPKLLRYSPSPFGHEAALQAYIDQALQARKAQVRYPFVIFDKSTQTYVGSTSYGNVSNYNRRLEIGWTWLAPQVQGTGLNTYCKHLLLTYAFDQLDFERVELKTDSRNAQSRRAIEKIGARFEGELRSHTLMLDGFRRNTVYYSILKAEWPEIKRTIFAAFT